MYTRFSISRINAFFALIAIVSLTLLASQFISLPTSAQAHEAPVPQQKQVVNQWEYKTIDLSSYNSGQSNTDVLNQEVSELQWELIAATKGYVVFRRPVKVIR